MTISYDSLYNISSLNIYLCDPQENRLAYVAANDRVFTACYNDLSTFELNVFYNDTSSSYYNLIETMRLLEVEGIGYFQITSAVEDEGSEGKFKRVTADSLQTVFKRFGIDVQNRVYCLYNTSDPTEPLSRHKNDDSFVPSIVAELKQQVGVNLDIHLTDYTPSVKYSEWTITYISDSLKYTPGGTGTCRTMDENVEYAYDLLVNKVEEAFGCVVVFDYMYKTIKFYAIENAAQRGNAYLSFDNFTTDMQVEENSDDIVTVLRCEGDGVDISLVNPTGTGYIVDFSYYKNSQWMSTALINKLNNWESTVESRKTEYENAVTSYRTAHGNIATYQSELTTRTKIIQDMQKAVDSYAEAAAEDPNTALAGSAAIGEHVGIGTMSIDPYSAYYSTAFSLVQLITFYENAPTWNASTGRYSFSGQTGHLTTPNGAFNDGYYYFNDISGLNPTISYCKLTATYDTSLSQYTVNGFDRFVAYKYLGRSVNLQEKQAAIIKQSMQTQESAAINAYSTMALISFATNISNYFADTPNLYAELKRYWIEGNYNDPTIAVHDTTTIAEQIDLANELLSNGKAELSKVCQPRFKLSIKGINVFADPELNAIADSIKLGDVLTVEKNDTTRYYPVLLKIVFRFDDPEQLDLELGNALRLDDWGYTLADLVTNSAQTARNVSANWQELISFNNERNKIYNLIENPLDSALRAANANMTNQNFSIDSTGILGRVVSGTGSSTSVGNEQIRILNNMILFTRDNWESAAAAFGKITIDGTSFYGLVAEALIGRILIGEQLTISNSDNRILLNGTGISILNASNQTVFSATTSGGVTISNSDNKITLDNNGISVLNSSNQTVFSATTSGNVTVSTGSGKVFINQNGIQIFDTSTPSERVFSATTNGNLYLKGEVDATYGTLSNLRIMGKLYFGSSDNYYLYNSGSYLVLPGLSVSTTDATFTGTLNAPKGNIGGWNIDNTYNKLEKTVGNYTTGLQASSINTADAFYVRYNNNGTNTTMFSVNNNGKLVANEAVVKGIVTASSLSVTDSLYAKDGFVELYGDVTNYGTFYGNIAKMRSDIWTPRIVGTGNAGGSSAPASINVNATIPNDGINNDEGTVKITYTYSNASDWNQTSGQYITFYIISQYNNRYVSDEVKLFVDSSKSTETESFVYQYSGFLFYGISKNDIDPSDPTTPPSGTSSSGLSWFLSTVYGNGGNTVLRIGSGVSLVPEMGSVAHLGLSLLRWNTVYLTAQPDVSSSRDLKKDIESFSEKYETFFDNLKPRSFLLKTSDDDRKHFGFVVDEVVAAVEAAGMTKSDCALYNLADDNDPYHNGSLSYGELIALLTWEIQKLKARVNELENL